MKFYSQGKQDEWVLKTLNEKEMEHSWTLGATPFFISNTATLEKQYDWRGIGVDLEPYSGIYTTTIRKLTLPR